MRHQRYFKYVVASMCTMQRKIQPQQEARLISVCVCVCVCVTDGSTSTSVTTTAAAATTPFRSAIICMSVFDRSVKGKLHSKIISSELWYERFFSVESNGKGPRSKFEREDGQTDGQKWPKNLGWRRRAAGMSHGARRQQFAAASRFWSIPNLMPRSTVTRVWLTEWAHLGQLCGRLTSDNLFFLFFLLLFCECCLTRAVTEYRVWDKVRGTAEEVRCYPQIPGW